MKASDKWCVGRSKPLLQRARQATWLKLELRVGVGFQQCLYLLSPSMCHFEKSKCSVYSQSSPLVRFHCITWYYAHIAELLKQVTQFKWWIWKRKVDTAACLLWLLELKRITFPFCVCFFTFFLIRKTKHWGANAKESILKLKSFLVNDGREYLNYCRISPATQCCLH